MGNILITDDDPTCRDSIRKVLEKEGHMVCVADDVDGALGELRERPFDLIVCDYRMPGKTGIDFLVELQRLGFKIPFLLISAYADATTTDAVLRLGGIGVLRKPIRRKELVAGAALVFGG
jgi:DNA-binding response OmpR family regulator